MAVIIGPTGEYPEGKLAEEDKGEIQFAIFVYEGKVVLDFGAPVAWVGMPAAQARELAAVLLQVADSLEPKSE
jgi:hypothetical protein